MIKPFILTGTRWAHTRKIYWAGQLEVAISLWSYQLLCKSIKRRHFVTFYPDLFLEKKAKNSVLGDKCKTLTPNIFRDVVEHLHEDAVYIKMTQMHQLQNVSQWHSLPHINNNFFDSVAP